MRRVPAGAAVVAGGGVVAAGLDVVAGGATEAEDVLGDAEAATEVTVLFGGVEVVVFAGADAATEVTFGGVEEEAGGATTHTGTADEVATEALVVTGFPGATAAAPPKLNDCVLLPATQAAASTTAPLTVKQVPAAFLGSKVLTPAPPVKEKSCELVTTPPPSARPPQENMITWFPAARRGSKFMQA